MKNNFILIITLLLIIIFPTCKAQNDIASNKNSIAKNVVYVEALGNGLTYSHIPTLGTLNYERTIISSPKINCAIRIGGIYYQYTEHIRYLSSTRFHSIFSCPILFNIISNLHGNNHIETGLGIVLTNNAWVNNGNLEIGYTGSIKYRYQKKTKGIYFSSGWTPSFYFDPYYKGIPLAFGAIYDRIVYFVTMGISIGYHF